MPHFNSRPIIMGREAVITSGHYLASMAGWRIIQQGGNAIDAAAATGFCLGLLEPHDNTLGGEVPMLIYSAKEKKAFALSGVGWSPKAFTIDWCRENGIDMIPGDGYLPACVPAVVGTWALTVARFGTMSLTQVMQPAIELAEQGFPVYPVLHSRLIVCKERFEERYPSSCELYMHGGRVPEIGELFRNRDYAETLRIMCRAEADYAHKGRVAGIEAARDAFYRGVIAERIVSFISENPVLDDTGHTFAGLLSYEDFAEWEATVEEPLVMNCKGLDVHKCSSWTQGPVFLQQLGILQHVDLKSMGHNSAEYIHILTETAKLAFVDREVYYGDPQFDDVPFDALLSREYGLNRRNMIGEQAATSPRPGDIGRGKPDLRWFDVREDNRRALGFDTKDGGSLDCQDNDTTHLNVIDREGNMIAATQSGGWIGSSPVIPDLGFPLGTRGQMFYLNSERPNALQPHKRPRATLTPTLITRNGEPFMVFGMRGGDVQDQHTLHFFLNHVEFGLDLQDSLDAPWHYTTDFPNSFYPRKAESGHLIVDETHDPKVVEELRRRGHRVTTAREGRNIMAVSQNPVNGIIMGAVCSKGEHAYGLGW